eukprot:COSAG06_NODE_50307_length_319_cov_1.495455_1_plen_32_part_10
MRLVKPAARGDELACKVDAAPGTPTAPLAPAV